MKVIIVSRAAAYRSGEAKRRKFHQLVPLNSRTQFSSAFHTLAECANIAIDYRAEKGELEWKLKQHDCLPPHEILGARNSSREEKLSAESREGTKRNEKL